MPTFRLLKILVALYGNSYQSFTRKACVSHQVYRSKFRLSSLECDCDVYIQCFVITTRFSNTLNCEPLRPNTYNKAAPILNFFCSLETKWASWSRERYLWIFELNANKFIIRFPLQFMYLDRLIFLFFPTFPNSMPCACYAFITIFSLISPIRSISSYIYGKTGVCDETCQRLPMQCFFIQYLQKKMDWRAWIQNGEKNSR